MAKDSNLVVVIIYGPADAVNLNVKISSILVTLTGEKKWFGLILLEVMEDRMFAQYQDYFLDEENLKFFSDFNLFGR